MHNLRSVFDSYKNVLFFLIKAFCSIYLKGGEEGEGN